MLYKIDFLVDCLIIIKSCCIYSKYTFCFTILNNKLTFILEKYITLNQKILDIGLDYINTFLAWN